MKKMLKKVIYAHLFVVVTFINYLIYAQGLEFDSGSDESSGEINITEDMTLDLPADGIFHATTITVAEGATLTFNRNALNTPVYLLATGDILINGTVDVSGTSGVATRGGFGGPGGFNGGMPGFNGISSGAGLGPGGGLPGDFSSGGAGSGAYGSRPRQGEGLNDLDGEIYGSPLLIPLVGGSGGGGIEFANTNAGGGGGGGGGGAILLSSNTRLEINGVILARGGTGRNTSWVYNAGSGGAIRLVVPEVFGTGSLNVHSLLPQRTDNIDCPSCGGHGRIRIDTILDERVGGLTFKPFAAGSVGGIMMVFPDTIPRLDLIEVAGQTIAEGATAGVSITLPFDADPNRTVVVQAKDFTGTVPIDVVLTPESGNPIKYPAEIDMAIGNPATVTVDVTFPVNTRTHVHVWTREE